MIFINAFNVHVLKWWILYSIHSLIYFYIHWNQYKQQNKNWWYHPKRLDNYDWNYQMLTRSYSIAAYYYIIADSLLHHNTLIPKGQLEALPRHTDAAPDKSGTPSHRWVQCPDPRNPWPSLAWWGQGLLFSPCAVVERLRRGPSVCCWRSAFGATRYTSATADPYCYPLVAMESRALFAVL